MSSLLCVSISVFSIFTARCTTVQSASWDHMSSVRPSVRLSVCNVDGLWWQSHKLEFFENNFTVS